MQKEKSLSPLIYRPLDSLYWGNILNDLVYIRMKMLTRATPEKARIIFIPRVRGEIEIA